MQKKTGILVVLATLMVATLLYADKGRGRGGKDRGREKPEAVEVETDDEDEAEVESIIVVEGTKPFEVAQSDIVRLTGKGIAGASASALITGPAKLGQQATIRRIVNGQPLIGGGDTEFDIEPTGKGTVTVTISVKFPNTDKPDVKTYAFTVK